MSKKVTNSGVVTKLIVAVSVGMAAFAVASLAGAHGGDTSLIHACVSNNGSMRIVGANEGCRPQETALDWNQSGPPGTEGPEGEQGPPGPAGPSGLHEVGQFTPTQIVHGAVLTCTDGTEVQDTRVRCLGVKLNGLDVLGGPPGIPNVSVICEVVTGKGWSVMLHPNSLSTYFDWDDELGWVLVTDQEPEAQVLLNMSCQR